MGGGLAGLATAAALRANAQVTILERLDEAPYTNPAAGAAAQLGPNGLVALRAIGGDALLQQVLSAGEEMTHIGAILPANNRTVMLIPDTSVADTGLPQILIRWGILRKLLLDLVDADSIHTSTGDEISGYDVLDGGGVIPVNEVGDRVGPATAIPPSLIVAAGLFQW